MYRGKKMNLKDKGCAGRTIGRGRFEKYMEFMNINGKWTYIPEAGGKAGYHMRDYRDIEERLSEGRNDYQQIPVPDEMRAKVEAGIMRARAEKEGQAMKGREEEREKEREAEMEKSREESRLEKDLGGSRKNMKRNKKKTVGFRIAAAVAAAAAVLVILPNTGASVAYAMGSIPVVGKLFQAVTFRDYQYESDRFDANVEVPQIVVDDMAGEGEKTPEQDSAAGQSKGEISDELQGTLDQINFDIEEVTNQLIEEFQASADLGESYGSLEIHHETVTNNDRYFTLKLSMYQGAGSGFESYKFYTIDKKTGKQVQLGDLFKEGSDYNERLIENIKDQMRSDMAEDENKIYWVDQEDVPEWNFERLKEDQNFYFDEAGNIVISFDEYEVAPGYMGALEFTVEREVFEDILK